MQLEQQDRGEQRKLKAIWHASKNRTPKKAEAPVAPLDKVKGQERKWIWRGETIESKGIVRNEHYTAAEIRKAGFKLPKLKKEKVK